jgi:hypothetical protein
MRRSLGFLAVLLTVTAASAHDEDGFAHPSNQQQFSTRPEVVLSIPGIQDGDRAVLLRAKRWRISQTLLGCFLDGDDAQRRVVVDAANDLLQGVNLRIDWGTGSSFRTCPADPYSSTRVADVRVTFQTCCWAWIGTGAHSAEARRRGPASIGLSRISGSGSAEERRIAYHELLHVFGFHHEHQNPRANCSQELDVAALQAHWGFNDRQMEQNLMPINTATYGALDATAPDPRSVMHYYFAPRFFRVQNPTCFIASPNMEPSATDRAALRRAYDGSSGARDVDIADLSRVSQIGTVPAEFRELLEGAQRNQQGSQQ